MFLALRAGLRGLAPAIWTRILGWELPFPSSSVPSDLKSSFSLYLLATGTRQADRRFFGAKLVPNEQKQHRTTAHKRGRKSLPTP
jgi:hypothetical protein